MGQQFQFSLDVRLSPTPTLNGKDNSNLINYIREVSLDSKFTLSVLHVLLEEQRIHMRDKEIEGNREYNSKIGDVMKAQVQVQSNAKQGIIGKLSHRDKGKFCCNSWPRARPFRGPTVR